MALITSHYTHHVLFVNRLCCFLFRLTFCFMHVTIPLIVYRAFFMHFSEFCEKSEAFTKRW